MFCKMQQWEDETRYQCDKNLARATIVTNARGRHSSRHATYWKEPTVLGVCIASWSLLGVSLWRLLRPGWRNVPWHGFITFGVNHREHFPSARTHSEKIATFKKTRRCGINTSVRSTTKTILTNNTLHG